MKKAYTIKEFYELNGLPIFKVPKISKLGVENLTCGLVSIFNLDTRRCAIALANYFNRIVFDDFPMRINSLKFFQE